MPLPVRLHLVKKLFTDLMGPKGGPSESITVPGRSYFVGILKPVSHEFENITSDPRDTTSQSDKSDPDESISNEEEEYDLPDRDLNPMRGASSMGMSFVICGHSPKIDICVTWGRYKKGARSTYNRLPNYFIKRCVSIDIERQIIIPEDPKSEVTTKNITMDGAVVKIFTKAISKDARHVSIFLVNETKIEEVEIKRANHHLSIFQPQIRINCQNGSKIQKLDTIDIGTELEAEYEIYSKRGNYGKGHMCGLIWQDIDPEEYNKSGFSEFSWQDSKAEGFPNDAAQEFTCPDIRTEFFPSYYIPQPNMNEVGYSAEDLSNIWNPVDLRKHLSNITEQYGKWITEKENVMSSSNNAMDNLRKCRIACERINKGIEFLESNEKARLAFCFMNKAMSLKSQWDRKKTVDVESNTEASVDSVSQNSVDSFRWREFQMGFMLQCISGVANKDPEWGDLCDVLWFPTGGGKTEAYLGLTIFAIMFRRLQKSDSYSMDGGVSVISRYTLRLLTIQQFQRAVGAITASEYLRVTRWIPDDAKSDLEASGIDGKIWGGRRISIGLLIGGTATPNKFKDDNEVNNAEGVLRGKSKKTSSGEPSQVLNCPCCHTLLALPTTVSSESREAHTIHWIFRSMLDLSKLQNIPMSKFKTNMFNKIEHISINRIGDYLGPKGSMYYEIKIKFIKKNLSGEGLNRWWNVIKNILGGDMGDPAELAPTLPQRPGYFFVENDGEVNDFVIYCPNSSCMLNIHQIWSEDGDGPFPQVPAPFVVDGNPHASLFMPIPAFTTDEQIFRKCPSMLISTVDKFAMMPFKPEFSGIFGNVDTYDDSHGYGRSGISNFLSDDESATVHSMMPFHPPSLIIQDELHLIEGPLGSMVGAYEVAFDILSSGKASRPKYIASSATVGEVGNLVGAIYRRKYSIFPPQGTSIDDNYFSHSNEDPSSLSDGPGRLHMGVCAPTGILTLPVKIWAILLSEVWKIRQTPEKYGLTPENVMGETDPYWTLVGYFNAKKELQIARSLYEDDITRDVDRFSGVRVSSSGSSPSYKTLEPGLRFFQIRIDKQIKIKRIILNAHKESSSVVISIHKDESGMPGQLIQTAQNFRISMYKGENEFVFDEPVECKNGEIVWISMANSSEIDVITIDSELQSYAACITKDELKNVTENCRFSKYGSLELIDMMLQITLVGNSRPIGPEPIELTGNTDSQDLPGILHKMSNEYNNTIDTVFTTSVFGTGIDIDRLGLMVMMGQPKTTSSYIQSTGRIGRVHPGLIISWFRATNVRDLNHYEDFVGYHRALQRFIEPLTASPFAEESLRLCLGPILVSLLRNAYQINGKPIPKEWVDNKTGPRRMGLHNKDAEIIGICEEIKTQIKNPNIPNKPEDGGRHVKNTIDSWHKFPKMMRLNELDYVEWALYNPAERNVVLGTLRHNNISGIEVVFKNVRTSMRNVESTGNFGWYDD
ncbi:MAG: hypothetical protein MPI91_04725 [Nitrosopumilus sp.]|nr:hypothetical protein [Nitrosopumilus sp.]